MKKSKIISPTKIIQDLIGEFPIEVFDPTIEEQDVALQEWFNKLKAAYPSKLQEFRDWLDNRRCYHSQQQMHSEKECVAILEKFDSLFSATSVDETIPKKEGGE
jgi:hypothetical protein